ncbi:sugar nucleotide-binding protein [Marinomonas ostreistagni]|uniref:sugar nucleotide-binding protein n=1 Tax=Marinomonas ostreistagni TaxID=359209 RepID=UPI0019528DB8|nr:sugar nucleotide-binding protein [Marinomonas ostreistagni]MBM6551196.1 sugar nucleotide-binding protein [Marinomonas ostreistagni]
MQDNINAPMRVVLLGSDTELGRAIREYYDNDFDFDWLETPSEEVMQRLSSSVLDRQYCDAIIDAYSLRSASQNDYAQFLAALEQVVQQESCPPIYMLSGVQVFLGDKETTYLETDEPDGRGRFANTLQQAEQVVLASDNNIVLRTGWLFSGAVDDFVSNTINLVRSGSSVTFHDTAIGSPTPVSDVARVLLSVVKQRHYGAKNTGIYHYCCSEEISWMGLVEAVLTTASQFDQRAQAELEKLGDTVNALEMATEIKRQSLSCRKIFGHYGIKQRSWRPVLRSLIKELYQLPSA